MNFPLNEFLRDVANLIPKKCTCTSRIDRRHFESAQKYPFHGMLTRCHFQNVTVRVSLSKFTVSKFLNLEIRNFQVKYVPFSCDEVYPSYFSPFSNCACITLTQFESHFHILGSASFIFSVMVSFPCSLSILKQANAKPALLDLLDVDSIAVLNPNNDYLCQIG